MQLLEIPTITEDMTVSLSMTGVTILKQSKFKARHQGATDIVQIPKGGFIIRPKKSVDKKPKRRVRKLTNVENSKETEPKITTERIPKYSIDKQQVNHRIRGFVNQMKGEKMLYFWTITFPEKTTDDTAYILLNKWLTRLRQERMLKEYLWIAERQTGERLTDKSKAPTNTLHFHMVINQKMNVQKANKFMRASIMHCINKGEINYSREAAMKYNGVDIAKDRKTRRVINFAKQDKQKALSNYLTKYVTKNDSKFIHLAWHSSRGYSNLITAVRFTWSEYQKGKCESLLNQDKAIEHEYYTFRRWKGSPPIDLLKYLGNLNHSIQTELLCQ